MNAIAAIIAKLVIYNGAIIKSVFMIMVKILSEFCLIYGKESSIAAIIAKLVASNGTIIKCVS